MTDRLIADAGATKTAWRLSDQEFITQGITPVFQTASDIAHILESELAPQLSNELKASIQHIEFYGAGISGEERRERVASALRRTFGPTVEILVAHDMHGAALYALGTRTGVACILGTGSNSCRWDGALQQIVEPSIPSLGYALGDEGSGAALGKTLLRNYYYQWLSRPLRDAFEQWLNSEKGLSIAPNELISEIYRAPLPSRKLASLAPFLAANLDHLEIVSLVEAEMTEFLRIHVLPMHKADEPVTCVGSIGWHFSAALQSAAKALGLPPLEIRRGLWG